MLKDFDKLYKLKVIIIVWLGKPKNFDESFVEFRSPLFVVLAPLTDLMITAPLVMYVSPSLPISNNTEAHSFFRYLVRPILHDNE